MSVPRPAVLAMLVLLLGTAVAGAGVMGPVMEPREDRARGETFGQGDVIEFNTSDLDLELGLAKSRVVRITNDGLRTDVYEMWVSTSGDAEIYTEYGNVERVVGERAIVEVEGRSTRGVPLSFSASTCYKATCSGSLTVHIQDQESGERYDMDMPLTVDRGTQGVQAPGIRLPHLVILLMLAASVVLFGRGPDD